MKLIFILLFMEPETKTGGFTPEEKTFLGDALAELKTALESKNRTEIEKSLKAHADTINGSIEKFQDILTKKDETDIKNQKALDDVLMLVKNMQNVGNQNAQLKSKSFQQAMSEALSDPENQKGIASVKRGNRFKMMLKGPINMSMDGGELYDPSVLHKMEGGGFDTKTVGDITIANNLTGQGAITLRNDQVYLPAQKVNARDLIPTVHSESGTYVFFRESATGEGSISRQTAPGAAKTQIDFDFARVEVVSEYIAGWSRFPKQLIRNLPFLVNSLPRLLQREFFKVENRRFWDIAATAYAAGGTPVNSIETDDVKEIIDSIAALMDADYVASFGLIRWVELARINKYLLTNGNYLGAGSALTNVGDGSFRVMGIPVLPVTWIPSTDKFMTFDRDYVERIEVESLAIEFFEQDDTNVQKNLITARIECFEEFNILQPKALVIRDLGNSGAS